jgi:hypothetical protein
MVRFPQGRLRAYPLVADLVRVRVERDRLLVLLDGPPDRVPSVAFEQVAVLTEQERIRPLANLMLEQRFGRQEIRLLAERLVPFQKLISVHNDRVLVHAHHAVLALLVG